MGRELHDNKPMLYPVPPLLTDYTDQHKGWGTVVGYGGKVPIGKTSFGNKKQSRRRHRWVCHCSKCNSYYKVSHQNIGRIFKNESDSFVCHSCNGKMSFK